jgi:transcriptional regulatory protein RtcR
MPFRWSVLNAYQHLWSFTLPSITENTKKFNDYINQALKLFEKETQGHGASFNDHAIKKYLKFAKSKEAIWPGNFRDLNASVYRMATLAENGIIDVTQVDEEIEELKRRWGTSNTKKETNLRKIPVPEKLFPDEFKKMGSLKRVELAHVLEVIANSDNGIDAYRTLHDTDSSTCKFPSQGMIRIINKLLPGHNFQSIKKKLEELK